MGTFYIHTSQPFYKDHPPSQERMKKVYDEVKEKIFSGEEKNLKIIEFENFCCVVFLIKQMYNGYPETLIELTEECDWSWLTDEGKGGFEEYK